MNLSDSQFTKMKESLQARDRKIVAFALIERVGFPFTLDVLTIINKCIEESILPVDDQFMEMGKQLCDSLSGLREDMVLVSRSIGFLSAFFQCNRMFYSIEVLLLFNKLKNSFARDVGIVAAPLSGGTKRTPASLLPEEGKSQHKKRTHS